MRLIVRGDASAEIGTGHVMRCLALAQAWQEDGGLAQFAYTHMTPALEARLRVEKMISTGFKASPGSRKDATQTIAMAKHIGADWVVVDGYHFDASYQRAIKEADLRLACVDDYGHASHYWADLVVNQNIYASDALYPSRELGTRLLLGTRYALLRREFWCWRGWTRKIPPVARKVLVTLGGTDSENVTSKVVQALELLDIHDFDAIVVLGGSSLHAEHLQRMIQNPQIRVVRNADNMPELMAWADVAVSAGGTTNWELAFMGLPIITVILAKNQWLIARELHKAGVAKNLGWYAELSPTKIARVLELLLGRLEERTQMSRRGQQLVDGQGGARVARELGLMLGAAR